MKLLRRPISWIMHHKKISAGIVVLAVIVYAIWPKPLPPIDTQKISYATLTQSLSVSGSVNGKTVANLTFPITGKVVYIGAKKGDAVKKYQTIASLDQRTVADNLKSAVDAAQNQQISYSNVYAFNGYRDLSDTGLSVDARKQLETAVNTLDQTQLAVEIQKIAQEQAVLVSPIDGILTRADIDVPGTVASLTTTYTVVDPTSIVLDMDVDQADIGKVKEGQQVTIVFDAYPDKTFTEQVSSIDFVSHTTTNGGNAFTVETTLPADAQQFRIGMNANADITLNQKQHVLTVPLSSVVDNQFVYVKKGNNFFKQKVSLGLQNDTDAEVTAGVQEGEEIALDPTQAEKRVTSGK